MRLRTRFAVALLVVTLVLSATVLVGFTLYRDAIVAQERAELQRTSDSVATQLDVVMAEKQRMVRLWAGSPPLSTHGSSSQRDQVRSFVRTTSFSGASVIAANGTMTAIHTRGMTTAEETALVGSDFGNRTYFTRALAGETFVSDPIDAETGYRIVTISAPIYADGELVGTFNAAYHVGDGDLAGVVDTNRAPSQGIRVAAGETTVFDVGPDDGADEVAFRANATVPETDWVVTASQTSAALDSRLWTVTLMQVGAFGLVLLSLAGFGGWLYREYVGNFERLHDGFGALVSGDYGSQVALSGSTEWEEIETHFNELSETLAQRRSEVGVLNRVLRHNLRNAMTVVVGNADRIVERTDDETIATDARRIRERGESLLELADHARAIETSLGAAGEEVTARPVDGILDEVVTVLDEEFPEADLSLATAPSDVWVPSGDLLLVAFDELGRNAVRHAGAADPAVRFEAAADDETVTVSVSDDGPGLPAVERRILTESFVETTTQHGTGLGLWLVKWLVRWADGEIEVSTGGGTTVDVTVPRVDPATDDGTVGSSPPTGSTPAPRPEPGALGPRDRTDADAADGERGEDRANRDDGEGGA